jgi:phosphatidylserine synthase
MMTADLLTALGVYCGAMAVLAGVTYYLGWDR